MFNFLPFISTTLLLALFSFSHGSDIGKITEEENQRLIQECDPDVKKINKRMMNGKRFDSSQMRYTVMLEIQTLMPSRCSGVIISPKHVLTAAHCFITYGMCRSGPILEDGKLSTPEEIPVLVHYGGTCVEVREGGKCPKFALAKKVKVLHIGVPTRYFESRCRSGDIAIVEVAEIFEGKGSHYEHACLPSNVTKLAKKLSSAGYGYDPHHISVKEKYVERVWFTKERFCDPTVRAGKDAFCVLEKFQFACRGDSGSGVMQPANSEKDYVMGVLSRGLNCDDVDISLRRDPNPTREFRGSVMTNVRKYLNFICLHAGVCEKHLDQKNLIKQRIYDVY